MSVDTWHSPTLLLVYLPHLDYNLQRLGPDDPRIREDVRAIDAVCGTADRALPRARPPRHRRCRNTGSCRCHGPVHINRVLREAGLLAIRDELGTDTLDAGASEAFAVADHQIAHVYVRESARIAEVAALLRAVPGIDLVLDRSEQRGLGLDHERIGRAGRDRAPRSLVHLLLLARRSRARRTTRARSTFTASPATTRPSCSSIRRSPLPKLTVAATLAKKALGFRYLMNVIPLDASLVKGSHGRVTESLDDGPLLISSRARRREERHARINRRCAT